MRRAGPLGLGLAALLAVPCCRRVPAPASIAISIPYQVETLDPHAKDRLGNAMISSHFYEPLVTLDSEMTVQARLAERWETPDPSTWLLHLRPGVRFHDGHPLTAEDVAYTFDRLRRDSALECGLYTAQITSVKALSEMEVEMKTARPMAFLLNKLSKVFIVPRGSGASLATRPNGTGPYRFAGREPGRIRMTANPDSWQPSPVVTEVTFLLERGAVEAATDVAKGRAAFAQCSARDAVRILEGRPDVRILRRSEIFVKMLGFDLKNAVTPYVPGRRNPFRNAAVREAISLAVDPQELVAALPASAVAERELVPPSIFGYDPSLPEKAHDRDRARRLLSESGLAGGFDVTLHTRDRFMDAARLVARQLALVGIRVTVEELSDEQFFGRASRQELSFFLISFGCASGDISDLFDSAFHTVDAERRYGTSNFGGFSDPDLDQAIEKSAEIPSPSDRREALQAIVRRVTAAHLLVPLYVDEGVCAIVRPFAYHPRANNYILANEIVRDER